MNQTLGLAGRAEKHLQTHERCVSSAAWAYAMCIYLDQNYESPCQWANHLLSVDSPQMPHHVSHYIFMTAGKLTGLFETQRLASAKFFQFNQWQSRANPKRTLLITWSSEESFALDRGKWHKWYCSLTDADWLTIYLLLWTMIPCLRESPNCRHLARSGAWWGSGASSAQSFPKDPINPLPLFLNHPPILNHRTYIKN